MVELVVNSAVVEVTGMLPAYFTFGQCHQLRLTEKLSMKSLVLRDIGNEMVYFST